VATPEVTEVQAMYWGTHAHPHEDAHPHTHGGLGPKLTSRPGAEPSAPTEPSRAVLLDIGEHAGALVLRAPSDREGMEVEIHPVSDPSTRTHVWVLPRAGKEGRLFAAVFPSLAIGEYVVLEPDGSIATTVEIAPNHVTNATWG